VPFKSSLVSSVLAALVALGAAARGGTVRDGLVLWLDAGDLRPGPVEAWTSRASGGLRAVQPTRAARPTAIVKFPGRKTTVHFDGNDFLSLGRPEALRLEPGRPFTVVVVADVAIDRIGTFYAKGGGADAHRAVHFYVANGRVGAVAYGARREAQRPAGRCVAMLVCDGRRATILVNGETLAAFPVGRGQSNADVLIGCRRKEADNTGTDWPLTGELTELLVYSRALGARELAELGRHLAERYSVDTNERALAYLRARIEEGWAAEAAEVLCTYARHNRLRDALAGVAAELLDHEDPFARGMAEWAIAMKVGGENNGQQTRWPSANRPEWYQQWLAFPAERRLEADWVRQAVSRGIHRDGRRLLADADAMVARAERMAADLELPAPLLARLRESRDDLAKALKDLPDLRDSHQGGWLDVRRAMRAVALANPAIDFEQVVFVAQFAPHTVRNITRSYQWKHKPGGGLCILGGLRPDAEVRPLIGGKLGPGFVWGMDLWWDADRVVFGYAKQPAWPPAVNTGNYLLEGRNVFELRKGKAHPPIHIYEIRLDGSGLRQLTDHPYWNDFEPTYCADGSVVFASDRCGRSAECGNETYDHFNPNLYLLSPDGRVRQLTDNKDIDRYPHSLADGRIRNATSWRSTPSGPCAPTAR